MDIPIIVDGRAYDEYPDDREIIWALREQKLTMAGDYLDLVKENMKLRAELDRLRLDDVSFEWHRYPGGNDPRPQRHGARLGDMPEGFYVANGTIIVGPFPAAADAARYWQETDGDHTDRLVWNGDDVAVMPLERGK